MENLVLFLFATAGATFIVVFSSLFEWLRNIFLLDEEILNAILTKQIKGTFKQNASKFLGQLVNCPLCLGFWMGAVMFLFILGFNEYNLFIHFAFACAGSAASYLFYKSVK